MNEIDETTAGSREIEQTLADPFQPNDSLIAYTRSVELPSVKIATPDCLQRKNPGVGKLRVTNCANFPYSVSINRAPDWLLVEKQERQFAPGESASFSLGLDQGRLPPGEVTGAGELVIRRPFINLPYAFEVKLAVEYVIPAPHVEVEAVAGEKTKTLRIAVRNAGCGLLQGYYYDRARNEHRTFLLAGDAAGTDAPAAGREGPSDSNRLFRAEKVFRDFDEVRGGILVLCDCMNERFRRFEIHPLTYFDREPFADVSVIDFMRVASGQRREREITVRHPDFLNRCSIVIPPRLHGHLSCQQGPAGRIRFLLSEDASVAGCVADYIEFNGAGGRMRRLPVIVSFSEGER